MPRADDLPSFNCRHDHDAVPVATRSASRAAARPARSRASPAVINAITDAIGNEDKRECRRRPSAVWHAGNDQRSERQDTMYETSTLSPRIPDRRCRGAVRQGARTPSSWPAARPCCPTMKQRLAAPSDVIDVAKIKDMIGIEVSGDTVTIKAATTHSDVAQSDAVQKAIPALAYLASHDRRSGLCVIAARSAARSPTTTRRRIIRRRCWRSAPTVKTNKRTIAAEDFFKGLFATALEDGEIITAVSFPIPAKAGYAKMRHPASRFALTGVFVAKTKSGDVRVAATGASQSGVVRVAPIEQALKANWAASALDSVDDLAERPARRHPRLGGLPCQPGEGDGTAGGDRRRLAAILPELYADGAQRCAPFAFYSAFQPKGLATSPIRRENLANQLIKNTVRRTAGRGLNDVRQIRRPPLATASHGRPVP